MKISTVASLVLSLTPLLNSGCATQADSQEPAHSQAHGEHGESERHGHAIVVTSVVEKDVVSTQQYVCQIHSCQHIEIRALEGGYLEKICVKEGQEVARGTLMFKILPTLYQARLDSEVAEVQRMQIAVDNAETLLKKNIVSPQELALKKAELAKAKAKAEVAQAELDFTSVTAPFDGIVDRQRNQQGSLIEEGDVLTTFSDNSRMWVYFNVPEARYLEYKAELDREKQEKDKHRKERDDDDDDEDDDDDDDDDDYLTIELKLANGRIFPHQGVIGAIEADFNNTTGNISFRADFPNSNGLLRNGQTGTILIHKKVDDAIVIPQRATYEILDKRYAFVVDKNGVVHQRDITIRSEQDDIFVIEKGLEEGEKIVLEGVRQIRDGDKVEYEFRKPEDVLGNLKHHAE